MANESEVQHLAAAGVNLLPEGAVMRGTIDSEAGHQLLLGGEFEGSILLGGQSRLVIGPTARVDVELAHADHIIVMGTVSGTLRANHIEIGSTAYVEGAVVYLESFNCERGAKICATIEAKLAASS